jgi:hypothetical protein
MISAERMSHPLDASRSYARYSGVAVAARAPGSGLLGCAVEFGETRREVKSLGNWTGFIGEIVSEN